MMHASRYTIKAMVLAAAFCVAGSFAQYPNTNSPLAINISNIRIGD